jgi:alpha-N-acetylglucosaminidase
LLNDFYKPRWQQFFSRLEESLQKGTEMDFVLFNKEIKEWEWKWVNARKDYSIVPTDDPVVVAKLLYAKYRKKIGNEL